MNNSSRWWWMQKSVCKIIFSEKNILCVQRMSTKFRQRRNKCASDWVNESGKTKQKEPKITSFIELLNKKIKINKEFNRILCNVKLFWSIRSKPSVDCILRSHRTICQQKAFTSCCFSFMFTFHSFLAFYGWNCRCYC